MPWTYNSDGTEEWKDEPETGSGSAVSERPDVPPAIRERVEGQVEQGMEVARIVAETRAKLEEMEKAVQRTEKFAKWMDTYRLEWLISTVIPIKGDIAASVCGLYIVVQARQAGVPWDVIRKMLINLGIDAAMGLIPVLGDILDFFYHANIKNAKLFREYYEKMKTEAEAGHGQQKSKGRSSAPEWIE